VPPAQGGGGFGGGLVNYKNIGAGLKDFFGFGPSTARLGGAHLQDMIAGKGPGLFGNLSKLGHSNAALLGGATLAMMGLQRGGVSGLAMTAAGGALVGFKYGGPLGAAIGGAIGLGAGLVRLFMGSATDKARKKIKSAYGVDIKAKGVLQQVVDIAKQKHGGNLEMAIRTAEVADLVRLYALTTGQSTGRLPEKMAPSTLVQSGGQLYQARSYEAGRELAGKGGLIPNLPSNIPAYQMGARSIMDDTLAFLHRGERVTPAAEVRALDGLLGSGLARLQAVTRQLAGGQAWLSGLFARAPGRIARTPSPFPAAGLAVSKTQPIMLNVTLPEVAVHAPDASDLLTKGVLRAVADNPHVTQKANLKATRRNFNRRELTSLQLSPGTLTS
jgi:hypothetical protein